MPRSLALVVATCVLAACPSGADRSAHPVPPGDAALRIRIAQDEARRAGGVADLAPLATHGAKQERLLALRALGRIGLTGVNGAAGVTGDVRTIAILVTALGDPDPEVIGAAAGAIGVAASLDDGDLGATDALIAAAPRGGAPVVEALGRAGTVAAQPALVQALGDPKLAAVAALALGRHGRRKLALSDASRRALIGAAASSDPAVRYGAVYALAREHEPPSDPAANAALADALGDRSPEIRAQAIAGLGRRKAVAQVRKAGVKLEPALVDRDWRVAVEAVRALGDTDEGKDAIAAAIAHWQGALLGGDPVAAHVVVEGEKALAGAAGRPLVAAALVPLADPAASPQLPELTRGWIACLAASALVRARPEPDLGELERCPLPDPLRLPLVADLISVGAGSRSARQAALGRLLGHADPRVRAAGLGAIASLWKGSNSAERREALATVVDAFGARDLVVAGAAVDAARALYELIGDGDHALLDAAVIQRAASERDPELGAAILELIGKRTLAVGVEACRVALSGDPVRAKAAAGCLQALGRSEARGAPALPEPPPVDVSAVIGHVVRWRVTTSRGEVVIRLHPEVAPWAVAAIVALTRKGFYDGLVFHRVVPDFVVQGGDPTGSGAGGPGFALPAEPAIWSDGAGYAAGGVGIADAGRDSGGSQWFVMHSRAPHLDGRYTWFGTVESGQRSADALLIGDRVVRAAVEVTP
ncbi:MAG TPA: peptidylprolyl isomerase [Kofleriaceae bacterium]|nr:peptidylprolyl isomerase [Kofleriaceae bacterium]